jgi:hypothetical protein
MTTTSANQRSIGFLRIPIAVWLVAVAGGVIGALLAEPGNFWGNTVPSTATFFVVAFIIGLAGWAVARRLRR